MNATSVSMPTANSIISMRQTSAVRTIIMITLIIVVIAILNFLYYFVYKKARDNNCTVMNAIYGDKNTSIRSIDDTEQFNYTLKDYYIKTAYNCCSSGNYKNDYVNTCALKDVLKQGVRGLDFEIFSINDQPVIATSTSDSYYVKETFNYVSFVDAMNVIRDYAFSSSGANNKTDPVILHLRIKSANQEMFKNFAKLLEQYDSLLLSKDYDSEYYGKNFGDVKLRELQNKIVIIVDRSNTAFLECPEFYKFVNMTSNSVFMRALHYYDIKFTPDMEELIHFNKQNMTIGMPDKGSNPENPNSSVMREMGCQMLAMRYQTVDANIEENEQFFEQNGYAFALKPENLRYIPETVPLPPPQNPELSFATKTVQSDYYKFQI